MAEPIDLEFRVTGNAEQGLRSMRGELQGVEQATTTTSGSWGNLSQQITAGVVALQAATGVIKGMASGLVSAAAEIERTAGVLNRFTGGIAEAIDRTNGLYTSLQLMTAQQQLVQSGLNISAKQFATLTVAANEYASAIGIDNVQALEGLINAVVTGGEELRKYGVTLEGATTIADKQERALESLSAQYGDVESSADTLAGRILNLDNALAEMRIEAIAAVNEFKEMNRAIDDIDESLQNLTGTSTEFEPYLRTDVTDAVRLFTAAFSEAVETVRDLLQAMEAVMAGDWDGFFRNLGEAARRNVARSARTARDEQLAADLASAREEALSMGGGGGGGQSGAPTTAFGARPGLIGGELDLGTSGASDVSGGGGGRRRGGGGGGGGGSGEELPAFLANMSEEDRKLWLSAIGRSSSNDNGGPLLSGSGDVSGILGELQGELASENEASLIAEANAERERTLELEETRARQEEDRAGFQRMVNEQVEREIQLRQQVVDQIAGGGQKVLKLVGATQGQMELWAGAAQVAKAIGSYPDPVGIVQHGLSAALHFKNAAEMGVGGGGEAKAAAGRAKGDRNARPTRPGGFGPGGSGSGAQQTINVNMPFPESQIGRANRFFERQSDRRFGSIRRVGKTAA